MKSQSSFIKIKLLKVLFSETYDPNMIQKYHESSLMVKLHLLPTFHLRRCHGASGALVMRTSIQSYFLLLRKNHLCTYRKRFVDRVKRNVIPAEAGIQSVHSRILSYRSSQDGLFSSMSLNFQALFHLSICFSLWNADSHVSWTSYQTRR